MMQLPEIELHEPVKRRPTLDEFRHVLGFSAHNIACFITASPKGEYGYYIKRHGTVKSDDKIVGYIDKDGRLHNVDMVEDDPPVLPETMDFACTRVVYECRTPASDNEIVYLGLCGGIYFATGEGWWERSTYSPSQYKPIRYVGCWKRGDDAEGGAG